MGLSRSGKRDRGGADCFGRCRVSSRSDRQGPKPSVGAVGASASDRHGSQPGSVAYHDFLFHKLLLHDPLTDLPFALLLPRPADLPFDPPATPASSCPHLTRVRGVSVAPAGGPFHSQ